MRRRKKKAGMKHEATEEKSWIAAKRDTRGRKTTKDSLYSTYICTNRLKKIHSQRGNVRKKLFVARQCLVVYKNTIFCFDMLTVKRRDIQ